jgi:hypothetical protein
MSSNDFILEEHIQHFAKYDTWDYNDYAALQVGGRIGQRRGSEDHCLSVG